MRFVGLGALNDAHIIDRLSRHQSPEENRNEAETEKIEGARKSFRSEDRACRRVEREMHGRVTQDLGKRGGNYAPKRENGEAKSFELGKSKSNGATEATKTRFYDSGTKNMENGPVKQFLYAFDAADTSSLIGTEWTAVRRLVRQAAYRTKA